MKQKSAVGEEQAKCAELWLLQSNEEQRFGFTPRSRKSTTGGIPVVLPETYREGQREPHCASVDLKKAQNSQAEDLRLD